MQGDSQSNEVCKIDRDSGNLPLIKSPSPFSRNSEISLSRPLGIHKLRKAQNKHLSHFVLIPFWDWHSNEKSLLRFCENNAKNFHWLTHFSFEAKYYSKLTRNRIIQTIKCLKAVQSLTHFKLVGRILVQSHLLVPLMRNFKRLQSITLDFSDYNVPPISRIFSALKNLMIRLKVIKLTFGYIWDPNNQLIKDLGPAISCLKHLKAICVEIYRTFFETSSCSKIAGVSSNWKDSEPALLLNFRPSDEKIGNQIFENIIQSIKHLPRLEQVVLSIGNGVSLENQELERFSKELPRKLKSLRVNLSKCQKVKKEGVLDFLTAIAKMSSLQDISLKFSSQYQIDDEFIKELLRCLNRQKRLESLFLSFEKCNTITESALTQFLNVISSNLNLRSLMLCFIGSKKSLTDYGLGKLGIAIENLKRLEVLALNFSQGAQTTDKGINNLSARFGSLEKLKKLVLVFRDCINVRGEISGSLFKELGKLHNLESVILDFKLCKRLKKEDVQKILPCSRSIKYNLSVNFE